MDEFLSQSPEGYRYAIRLFQARIKKPLHKVKKTDLEAYRDYLLSKYKINSARYYLAVVRVLFHYLDIPFKIRIPKQQFSSLITTRAEASALLKVCDVTTFIGLRDSLMIRFMMMGLRVGEIKALKISHFDIEKRTAVILSEKSFNPRHIAWKKQTHDQIVRYIQMRKSLNRSQQLFVSVCRKQYTPISIRGIQLIFSWLKVKAGITRSITPHDFRHFKAHSMRKEGADLQDIQIALGHTNPVSTFNYLNLCVEEKEMSCVKFARI